MARRWRRKFLRGLLAVTLVVVAAVGSLPWWWPSVARRMGVTIGRATTAGWSRVELRDVRFVRDGLEVTIASLRVPAFVVWPRSADGPSIVAGEVFVSLPTQARRPAAPEPSARRLVEDAARLWPTLERWLPPARVERLEIAPSGAARHLRFTGVQWNGHRLQVDGPIPGRDETATLNVQRSEPQMFLLTLTVPAADAHLAARVRTRSESVDVEADLAWGETQASATATFGPEGFVPVRAALDVPELRVPADVLALPAYGPVAGSFHATWDGDSYAAEVVAHADPADANAGVPPLDLDLRAAGDFARLRVESAQVRMPGIDAHLSAPLELTLPDGAPAAPAQFSLEADLGRLPLVAATGRVTGRVDVTGGPGLAPSAEFALAAAGVGWRGRSIAELAVEGRWRDGRLQISRGDARLDAASEIHATAELDLREKRIVAATAHARLAVEAVRAWLPGAPAFGDASVEAKAQGPWSAPEHSGALAWHGLAAGPGPVDGDVAWKGNGLDTVELGGGLRAAGGISLPFAASLSRAAGAVTVGLTKLAWQDGQGEWWHLAQPAQVLVSTAGLEVRGLVLTGESAALQADAAVEWPAVGHVTVSARNFAAARAGAWLAPWAWPATLEELELDAAWENGPVRIDGAIRAAYAAGGAPPVKVEAALRTESEKLVFGSVRVSGESGVVLQGEGRLPLHLAGRADGFQVGLPRDGEISLQLDSMPNAEIWAALTRATGWRVSEPRLHVQLAGSLAAPHGRIALAAQSVQPPAGTAAAVQLPSFGDVNLVAIADAAGVRLEQAYWTIEGNWVSASGRAPWSAARRARETGAMPWREVEFSLAADRLPMAIASRAMPRVVGPDGTLSFKFSHRPGAGFQGFVWLDQLGLRPVQPLGAVHEIGGAVLLDGYRVTLRNAAAYLGGRPVELGGGADLTDPAHPTFDFHLVSAQVPLVRQEGLVVRAGLDLRVQQGAGGPARVTGSAELGRSVFVSDLVSLLPTGGGIEQPEQRPPFFSVPVEPFAHWRLDVALRGTKFLRIQTPFFSSEFSADFSLGGTLAEPRAQGRAWADEGRIVFPFGTLAVQEAEVSLTPEDPFTLALRAAAASRLYGYDIRLAVSGTAQEPRLQFSSDPPLSSQQLFLMLSAGELPESGTTFTSSERAQRLGWFVARNLASTFGLGGDGGGDRLEVRSGEDFSREGAETVVVEYGLDGRWSLVGEKDRFDAYNAGVKFKLLGK